MESLIYTSKNEKGVYSLLSAFLFIVVVLAVIFGMVYLQGNALIVEASIWDSVNSFEIADDIRQAVKHHYGEPICEADLYESNLPDVSLIKGLSVENYGLLNCTARVWKFKETERCNHKFVYLVNTREVSYYFYGREGGSCEATGNVCLSKVEVCV